MRILIIEDEKLLADSLKALLEQNGFEADAACDGKTGEYYAALGIYDLLILDVMMPGRDGYEVARRLRERRMEMPILMLTARSELDDRVTGLNAGADYYLTKPFDTQELLACVNALLRRQGVHVDVLSFGNTVLDLASATLVCKTDVFGFPPESLRSCGFFSGGREITFPRKRSSPRYGDMTLMRWKITWRYTSVF